jgi:hypothetical protein
MLLKKSEYINIDLHALSPEEATQACLQMTRTTNLQRIFFEILKDNSVQYQLGELKFEGSFNAFWKNIFAEMRLW